MGYGAGPTSGNQDVDLRLYIDVDTNNTNGNNEPLIYGEFDNDFVKINGTFEVTAGLMNPSSVELKEDFTPMDQSEVLEKVAALKIMEWSYKTDPNVRHVGPTAEDFYELFGLGQGSKTLSTMDADGVALMAIQALNDEVKDLQEENAKLKVILHELVDRLERLKD